MNKLKSLITLLLTIACIGYVNGQSECTKKLKEAERLYDHGNLIKVSEVLSSCLEGGFTREEKSKAYKLMCMRYLYDDEIEMAEKTLVSLLHEDPEYYVNREVEEIEFLKLYDKFRTNPSYSISIGFGVNQTIVSVGEPFGVHNIEEISSEYEKTGLGITFQGTFNKFLKPNLIVGAGLDYKTSSYNNNLDLGYTSVSFVESFSTLDLPFFVKYEYGNGKLRPYVKAGAGISLLMSSKAKVVRKYSEQGVQPQSEETGPEVELKEQRNKFNYFAAASLGLKYKIPMAYLFLDLRYNYGLSNSVDESMRYANKELTYKYYYVDDNFFVNNAIVSIGYERLFYNPKKKKIKNE